LRPHLERWKKFSTQYVIEYDGKPITSQLRRAWNGARLMADLSADVTPHVLKHSGATLMLQAGISTDQRGRDPQTYGHHSIEHLRRSRRVVEAHRQCAQVRGFRGGEIERRAKSLIEWWAL
jgi:integrase